jgi:hypothetical protein
MRNIENGCYSNTERTVSFEIQDNMISINGNISKANYGTGRSGNYVSPESGGSFEINNRLEITYNSNKTSLFFYNEDNVIEVPVYNSNNLLNQIIYIRRTGSKCKDA